MGGEYDKNDTQDKGMFSSLAAYAAGAGHYPQHGAYPPAYPPPGYPPQGYPPHGYPHGHAPPVGYPPMGGYPPAGYPPHGYPPPHGYSPSGYPGPSHSGIYILIVKINYCSFLLYYI